MGSHEEINVLQSQDDVALTANVITTETAQDLEPSSSAIKLDGDTSEKLTYTWRDIIVTTHGQPRRGTLDMKFEEKRGGFFKSRTHPRYSKEILKGVTGAALPYEALAIMGSSGAGKTTLLNVLTASKTSGLVVCGDRCINEHKATSALLSSVSAYVHQDDLFIGSLTVREHLRFIARVRMRNSTYAQRKERIDQVMSELGLVKCADTTIGYPGRAKGISGGEMRRLSFASEILTDPQILFCDEPTSGLDSYMSQIIAGVLKSIAKKGKTIICTIHQPSSQVYAMFDKILYMAEGRTAYLGDLQGALDFFQSTGHPCPMNFNPSDFFIQLLAVRPTSPDESRKLMKEICDAYDHSVYAVNVKKIIASMGEAQSMQNLTKKTYCSSHYKTSCWNQFISVLWRSILSIVKDPMVIGVRFISTIFASILIGLAYWDQKPSQMGVVNINGSLFLIMVTASIQNCFAVALMLAAELPVFYRENSEGLYRTIVFLLSKTIAELPMFVLIPFMMAGITYWMIGYGSSSYKCFHMAIVITLLTNISVSYGYLWTILCGDLITTLVVLPIALIPMLLFGGFLIIKSSVLVWLRWFHYVSWFYYGWEALAVNQWENVSIDCPLKDPVGSSFCLKSGHQVLQRYELHESEYATDLAVLMVMVCVYRFVAYLALVLRVYMSHG